MTTPSHSSYTTEDHRRVRITLLGSDRPNTAKFAISVTRPDSDTLEAEGTITLQPKQHWQYSPASPAAQNSLLLNEAERRTLAAKLASAIRYHHILLDADKPAERETP